MLNDIDRLIALQEIKALKARYFRTLDSKDWAGHRAVFAPDLIADFRDSSGERNDAMLIHGSEAYVAGLSAMLDNVVTVHHGHMAEIQFQSADEATGIWAMEDKLWVPEGSVLPFRFMHGYGHYHESYVRLGDGWRIQATRLSRIRVDLS